MCHLPILWHRIDDQTAAHGVQQVENELQFPTPCSDFLLPMWNKTPGCMEST